MMIPMKPNVMTVRDDSDDFRLPEGISSADFCLSKSSFFSVLVPPLVKIPDRTGGSTGKKSEPAPLPVCLAHRTRRGSEPVRRIGKLTQHKIIR